LATAVPILPSGKIRIVALVEKARYAAMPDVPTISETLPGFQMPSWLGLFAPVGTPVPVIARINETVRKILLDPPIKERLATLGLIVAPGTPDELSELIRQGLAVRGDLIKAANIKPE